MIIRGGLIVSRIASNMQPQPKATNLLWDLAKDINLNNMRRRNCSGTNGNFSKHLYLCAVFCCHYILKNRTFSLVCSWTLVSLLQETVESVEWFYSLVNKISHSSVASIFDANFLCIFHIRHLIQHCLYIIFRRIFFMMFEPPKILLLISYHYYNLLSNPT